MFENFSFVSFQAAIPLLLWTCLSGCATPGRDIAAEMPRTADPIPSQVEQVIGANTAGRCERDPQQQSYMREVAQELDRREPEIESWRRSRIDPPQEGAVIPIGPIQLWNAPTKPSIHSGLWEAELSWKVLHERMSVLMKNPSSTSQSWMLLSEDAYSVLVDDNARVLKDVNLFLASDMEQDIDAALRLVRKCADRLGWRLSSSKPLSS